MVETKQKWRVNKFAYKNNVLTGLTIEYRCKTITALWKMYDRTTIDTLTPAVRFRRVATPLAIEVESVCRKRAFEAELRS